MKKIRIVVQREFVTRVNRKSFIILTVLMPFIFAAIIFVPLLLSMIESDEKKNIAVIDHTGIYIDKFENDEAYVFIPKDKMLDEFKSDTTSFDAVIEIRSDLRTNPDDAAIYSKNEIPLSLTRTVNNVLNKQIRHDKMTSYNIENLDKIITDFENEYSIKTIKWTDDGSEKESNVNIAIAIGIIFTFVIYIFVLSYGGMVMQSVMEEKTNRIVELMVSSVTPFQLMIGKIIGIGLVGILQLLIWGVMLAAIIMAGSMALGLSAATDPNMMANAEVQMQDTEKILSIFSAINNLNLTAIGGLFILNFIGGYLVYASIFAAIGASVNEQEDSQQFLTPIIILIIFALYAGMYGAENPEGPLAFWCSMIPFTSPIVSMVRVALDVPAWETVMSLLILYITAFFMIWIAGRIYRIGILMYGKKPSFSEMMKWVRYK